MRFVGKKGSFESHEFSLEKEFEKRIYEFKDEIFRGGTIVRWEPVLKCALTDEGVQPDSLLVDLEFNEWWVVEVELGRNKKISAMVDQLGKLRRVDYTKHRRDIYDGLVKMGLSEEMANEKSRYFCSTSPQFMLILDKENQEMMSQAKDRGFVSFVVETFRNSDYETRIRIPKELLITQEPPQDDAEKVELRAPDFPEKPTLVNGNWWFFLSQDCPITDFTSITIRDKDGTFVCNIDSVGEDLILQMPSDRNSINSIIKGNKVGELYDDEIEGLYNLTLRWT